MGLFSRTKLKIKVQATKKDGFSGWIKCSQCHDLIHATELEKNCQCCPKCGYHYRLSVVQRRELLTDEGSFVELFDEIQPSDPLQFVDTEEYQKRLQKAQQNSGRDEAIMTGTARLKGIEIAIAFFDFSFMAGSMGSVVGERITRLIELAIERSLPLVIVSASGGARMQESILSLMQMAKTSAALAKLHEKGVPYISILTNPTTGGVTASFASLGDIIIAEPGALIGFAGPRVVEQTIGQKLPPRAQKADFLLEKGMIDCVVNRSELKDKVALFLTFLTGNQRTYRKNGEYKIFYGQSFEKLPQRLKELLSLPDEVVSESEQK